MEAIEQNYSLASDSRIKSLLDEAESELNKIQPEIDYLENCVSKLNLLKQKKNKLLSLMASLKVILNSTGITSSNVNRLNNKTQNDIKNIITSTIDDKNITQEQLNNELKSFIPEVALNDVKRYLRIKNNLNYEIFKAVVYNGGEASTDEIKTYLVTNKIRQPKTGKLFDDVELKDISSRANYLVRKQLLVSIGSGIYKALLGYTYNN